MTRANTKRARTSIDNKSSRDSVEIGHSVYDFEPSQSPFEVDVVGHEDAKDPKRKRKKRKRTERALVDELESGDPLDMDYYRSTKASYEASLPVNEMRTTQQGAAPIDGLRSSQSSEEISEDITEIQPLLVVDGERECAEVVQGVSEDQKVASRPMVLVNDSSRLPDSNDYDTRSTNYVRHDNPTHALESRNASHFDESPDELGADNVADNLPKERYQPRPSRSRRGDQEDLVIPEDFSKRPETVLKGKKKRKSKRAKTTAFVELIPKAESEDEEENGNAVLKDSGYHIPDFNKGCEDVSANDTIDAAKELPPLNVNEAPKKQRGRPKKSQEKGDTSGTEELTGDQSKARQSDRDDIVTDKAAQGKRGRKKLPVVNEDSEDEAEAGNVARDIHETQNTSDADGRHTLREVDGNVQQQTIPEKPKENRTVSQNQNLSTTPNKTPAKPAKGPDKHSPISSAKVAYRVGLSKRARIEPLLRLVRK